MPKPVTARWTFTGRIVLNHPDMIKVRKDETIVLDAEKFHELAARGLVVEDKLEVARRPKAHIVRKGRPKKVKAKVIRPEADKSEDNPEDTTADRRANEGPKNFRRGGPN